MRVIKRIDEFRDAAAPANKPLGLVPTMGALHEGHMSLVRLARSNNATVVASIFVNPTQFGPSEDFATYPRDTDSDLALLEEAGVNLVFMPSVEEMYPEGSDTYVDPGRLGERLEGESRPGHFRGVATVVCKLLSIARPDRAYFGQKDAQQNLVIKRVNTDLALGAEIVVGPTAREPDGLALSSRNAYLGTEERRAATVLYRALCAAADLGTSDASKVRTMMRELIESEPLAQVDYVSVADASTLEDLDVVRVPALASVAVHVGRTRLIDNILLAAEH